MKNKYSSALLIIVLMLVAGIGSVKINLSFPKSTIFNKILTTNLIETTQTIDYFTNKLVRIKNMRTGKCIKFVGPNTKLNQFTCADTLDFYWIVSKNQDNSYLISSKLGNYVFDNNGGKTNNGNPILAWALHAGSNQKWYINSWGGSSLFRFTSQQSRKCLDLKEGTSNDGPLFQLWDCQYNNENQGFNIELKKDESCHDAYPQIEKLSGKWLQIVDPGSKLCLKNY